MSCTVLRSQISSPFNIPNTVGKCCKSNLHFQDELIKPIEVTLLLLNLDVLNSNPAFPDPLPPHLKTHQLIMIPKSPRRSSIRQWNAHQILLKMDKEGNTSQMHLLLDFFMKGTTWSFFGKYFQWQMFKLRKAACCNMIVLFQPKFTTTDDFSLCQNKMLKMDTSTPVSQRCGFEKFIKITELNKWALWKTTHDLS